jgi:hypothetical protein
MGHEEPLETRTPSDCFGSKADRPRVAVYEYTHDRYPLWPRVRMLGGILCQVRADGTHAAAAGSAAEPGGA